MDAFFENAQRIFDVARAAGDAGSEDFALLVGADGGLHFVMESPFSLDAAAIHCGARTAYRITRSRDRVRVEGRSGGRDCSLEERSIEEGNGRRQLLPDQALYRISS